MNGVVGNIRRVGVGSLSGVLANCVDGLATGFSESAIKGGKDSRS